MFAGITFAKQRRSASGHYDSEIGPLGKLSVERSYSTNLKVEKEVKTKIPRDVRVHPVLAVLLPDWKESGGPAMLGRRAGSGRPDHPFSAGKNRSANHMLKKFQQDLERLGIRAGRQHDLRRTSISLCLGDGGRSDILRWVTHSRPKSATFWSVHFGGDEFFSDSQLDLESKDAAKGDLNT
ncbi:MAG TPA: hypothetical protein VFG23_21725 [Polyangia bacterium]|nr:hypothetical protein [Polyangia bacterium]